MIRMIFLIQIMFLAAALNDLLYIEPNVDRCTP